MAESPHCAHQPYQARFNASILTFRLLWHVEPEADRLRGSVAAGCSEVREGFIEARLTTKCKCKATGLGPSGAFSLAFSLRPGGKLESESGASADFIGRLAPVRADY